MQAFVAGDFYTGTSRPARALASGHAGFVREYDVHTDEELAADPIYTELLWPAGLGWCAATAISLPTGDELFLCFEREHARSGRSHSHRTAGCATPASRPFSPHGGEAPTGACPRRDCDAGGDWVAGARL
jgi:hypothetical protein